MNNTYILTLTSLLLIQFAYVVRQILLTKRVEQYYAYGGKLLAFKHKIQEKINKKKGNTFNIRRDFVNFVWENDYDKELAKKFNVSDKYTKYSPNRLW